MPTIADLVRSECANYRSGCLYGECQVTAGGKCHVRKPQWHDAKDGEGPQDWFSACVAPLAKQMPQYADAVNAYALAQNKAGVVVEKRKCECGTALPKGRQCCDKCRLSRRREATRKRVGKLRASCNAKLGFSSSEVVEQ